MFVIDLRNKLVGKYCFSVMNNNDVDTVYIYSHFTQYKDYLCYLKVISEDETYVDEFLIDSEKVIIDDNALRVEWTLGAISTHCKKISIQLEFRESNEEDSKVAQSSIVDIVLGDTLDVSEKCAILYPDILKSLQHQIDELDDGSVASFTMTYISDVLTINLKNAEGESVAELQATIPTSTKVDKVAGKGLSTNDFTDALLNKLNSIAEHAQVNVLEGVQVDGNDLPIDANKKVNIANKVTKTDSADKVYGTDGSGNQTTLPVDNAEGKDGNIARRKQTSGQVSVPTTPVANDDATSKQYVDAFGKTIELTVDPTTYVLTAKLKDANGNVLATQTVDLPLESVVVSGSYDSATQSIILVLQNGSTITIPVAGLISGLVSQADFDALALRVTTAEGNIVTLGNTKVNYNDINVSGGFVISLTKNGSTYPIAEVVNVSATPVVVQHTSDLPAQNDGNLYVVLDNGYLYAWSNGWQQLYEYTSDLLTITEVTAGEVIYSYISDKGHSNRPIQVESAVRDGEGNIINETYAKKIGYEPRLSVGSADNINSDRQIDDPEASCPPTTMGITGGEAEIKTGIENFEYMEGKSEKFNQLVENGNFADGTSGWTAEAHASFSVANGVCTITNDTADNGIYRNADVNLLGHKVLLILQVKGTAGSDTLELNLFGGSGQVTGITTSWQDKAVFSTVNRTRNKFGLYPHNANASIDVKNVMCIDLTAMYGAGNEPTTIAEFKADYPLDYYAYNAGEILSAKVAKLISRGRQQWDEEVEVGTINVDTGNNQTNGNYFRTKNHIPVISDQDYYFYEAQNDLIYLFYYDINKNYLGYINFSGSQVKHIPANVSFIRFVNTSRNTYSHDITISIYFEDGEGYDKYYAYSAQEVTLPNIELRGIGDLKDIAYAQGGGKRRLGTYTFTGEEGVVSASGNRYYITLSYYVSQAIKDTDPYTKANAIIYGLETVEKSIVNSNHPYSCGLSNEGQVGYMHLFIYLNDSATAQDVINFLTGKTIVYELAEETELTENEGWTEQVLVDNYGTLQFVTDPQQVPQVEQPYFIRYTIDLKEFLDGTYTHAQGDPQNLALKEDVEALKEDIERGDVVAGKSETADNLTPYSEDSGTTQTVPFINQGTGCGNGETQVDTGKLALMKKKEGNLIIANQLLTLYNFETQTVNGVTFTKNNDGSITVNGTSEARVEAYINSVDIVAGHKYLIHSTVGLLIHSGTWSISSESSKEYTISEADGTAHNSLSFDILTIGLTFDNVKFVPFIIDLTQMFGSNDNIPPYLLAHPEAFFNYYQGSLAYNTGTPVNSNATKLKAIGRNVWDEEYEAGYFNPTTGEPVAGTQQIRSKNLIEVSPNTTYHFRLPIEYSMRVFYLDKDGNMIDTESGGEINFTTPANCCYIKFHLSSGYGATYNNDITISRYYEGESGYDQYYPYEVLTETDTGNEVLRSAGSVRDYKEPNGTIHRKVGRVDLGDLDWAYQDGTSGGYNSYFYAVVPNAKIPTSQNEDFNGICSKYTVNNHNSLLWISSSNKEMAINTGATAYLEIVDTSAGNDPTAFKQSLVGVYLFYELEEEVIEEGTPFAENVKVDDFGSMMWEGEGFNGVPMGAEIFYPIDYKAEMDTLHNHCDGDITSLVRQSDLAESEQARDSIDAQLKNALGGTLRNVLAVKESIDFTETTFIDLGDLTFTKSPNPSTQGGHDIWYSSGLSPQSAFGKAISTKYRNNPNPEGFEGLLDGEMFVGNEYIVFCTSQSYADATAFKNANKGVLVAYKKAS